jgi:predicted DNA-binding transcriptional regulator AlpA
MSVQHSRVNGGGSAGAEFSSVPLDSQTLLTIEDVAELLKVPVSWVYEHTRRKTRRDSKWIRDPIPGFRLGKYWRFRRAEILEWLERQRLGAKPNA